LAINVNLEVRNAVVEESEEVGLVWVERDHRVKKKGLDTFRRLTESGCCSNEILVERFMVLDCFSQDVASTTRRGLEHPRAAYRTQELIACPVCSNGSQSLQTQLTDSSVLTQTPNRYRVKHLLNTICSIGSRDLCVHLKLALLLLDKLRNIVAVVAKHLIPIQDFGVVVIVTVDDDVKKVLIGNQTLAEGCLGEAWVGVKLHLVFLHEESGYFSIAFLVEGLAKGVDEELKD
jgi:hypothetical protein